MNRFTLSLLFLLALAGRLSAQSITWITACTDQTFCLNAGTCSEGNVMMSEAAVTNCIFSSNVEYSYKIDLNNNGGIDVQSPNDTCTGPFPKGTHRIYWRASDGCGNVGNCSYLFTIKDCTPPSLLCLNGLTQNLEVPDCASTFTANQFVLSYSDNCTPTNQLQLGIRETGTGTGFPTTTTVTFNECDIGLNFVEIWIKDGNGLMNICQNYVLVQQNGAACTCNPDAEIGLHGCVRTAGNKKMANYRLHTKLESLAGVQPPILKTNTFNLTDSCFSAEFIELPFGGQYRATVRPERSNNPVEGVSTFDLVLMSKHVLGIDPFPSAYQWLAADVNKSNSVTTFDIVETRKLLLGIYDTFPANTSWRFIQPLLNPTDLNALVGVKDTYQITLNNLLDDINLNNLHFVGIKIGDANLSASFANEPEDRSGALLLLGEDRWLAAGESATVTLRLNEAVAALSGWQLALHADPALLQLEGVENLPEENVSLRADGGLRALWFAGAGRDFVAGEVLLQVKIKALQAVRLSDALRLEAAQLLPEVYAGSGQAGVRKRPLALQFAPADAADAAIQVFPPYPNPCREAATLGVVNELEATTARLSVADLSGKIWWQSAPTLGPGYAEIVIPTADFPAGVLVWRLQAGERWFGGRLVKN